MLCHICGIVDIQEIIIDQRDGKIRHCSECQRVIEQNLQDISRSTLGDDVGELPVIEEAFDTEEKDLGFIETEEPGPMAYQRGFWRNG